MGEGAAVCGADEQTLNFKSQLPTPNFKLQTLSTLFIPTVYSLLMLINPEVLYVNSTEKLLKSLRRTYAVRPRTLRRIPATFPGKYWTGSMDVEVQRLSRRFLEGETMVDLGAGAGIDCFIAAKKVGPKGKIYGIDMTDEMLKVANENKQFSSKESRV